MAGKFYSEIYYEGHSDIRRTQRCVIPPAKNRQRPGHTLQTTALVHEAYMRLIDSQDMDWQSRSHFFNVAAKIMRHILVNHAVSCSAEKRGGDRIKLSLDEVMGLAENRDLDILALNDALNELAQLDERQSQIVELKFFAGLANEEIAEVMEISLATVNREWRVARAWFQSELISKDS